MSKRLNRIASAALACVTAFSLAQVVRAETAANAFVVVEAEGVRIGDGDVIHFANATSATPVRVIARTGRLLKGLGQEVVFSVVGENDCSQCECRASASAIVDVYEGSIVLKEVAFSGANVPLVSDENRVFSAPQFLDADGDGAMTGANDHSYPVCYVRGATDVQVSAKFSILPAEMIVSNLLVKGVGSGGFPLRVDPAPVGVSAQLATLPPTRMSGTLQDCVDCLREMAIDWSLSFDGGATWLSAGRSQNVLYLTWATPCSSPNLQTYFDVGCEAAKGVRGTVGVSDDQVLDRVWAKFRTKSIRRVSDNGLLTYYGFLDMNGNAVWDDGIDLDFNDPDRCVITSASGLVKARNGQCYSWADFFLQVLRAQGLDEINGRASRIVEVRAVAPRLAFAVKSWEASGTLSSWRIASSNAGLAGENVVRPLQNGFAQDLMGTVGQGNSPNPPSHFCNHFLALVGGRYYDPSYGVGPFLTAEEHGLNAFAGEIREVRTEDQSWYVLCPLTERSLRYEERR